MRRTFAVLALTGVLATAAASFTLVSAPAPRAATAATPTATFIVPANDGYGVADCLEGGASRCGQVVADAWCETHGYARAVSFGLVDPEVTGSVQKVSTTVRTRPFTVTCAK